MASPTERPPEAELSRVEAITTKENQSNSQAEHQAHFSLLIAEFPRHRRLVEGKHAEDWKEGDLSKRYNFSELLLTRK